MVVQYLRGNAKVEQIGIWGRSMGAVTTLLFCSQDPGVSVICCDSPFSTLRKLVSELAGQKTKIPGFIVSGVMHFVRKSILKLAKFDINNLNAIDAAKHCSMPVIFITSEEDTFVSSKHVLKLH